MPREPDVSLALYMDVHLPRSVTDALRRRGVSVLLSQEDGTAEFPDEQLLQRASELGRVLVTQDDDLLAIAHRWQADGIPFGGVIYGHQLNVSVGRLVADLELLAACGLSEDCANQVIYLPLP